MTFSYFCRLLLILGLNLSYNIQDGLAQDFKNPRRDQDEVDNDWFHFVTRPDIQAPKFDVRIYDEDAISPGYWFVSPYDDRDVYKHGEPWTGPLIYDGNGSLIWSGAPFVDFFRIWDFRVAEFDGEPMLTGFSFRENAGMIVNSNYEFVKEVQWTPDIGHTNRHEFNLIEHGTRALVLTANKDYKVGRERSKAEAGFDGECVVEHQGLMELDLTVDPPKTVFEWNGLDHIGMDETTMLSKPIEERCTQNWDLHHFNALDKFPNGDYLLSSRHTSTIYRISPTNGSILWRLGGVKSDFEIPPNLVFSRQHYVRFREQNATHIIISFFDNAEGWDNNPTHGYSRGVTVALQPDKMTAELLVEAAHPLKERSVARGNNQLLPSGNFFIGWSTQIRMSEHSPNGRMLLHASSRHRLGTYRSYKFPWVGRPKFPPSVYSAAFVGGTEGVRTLRLITKVAVSWNGATEVRSWRLYKTDAKGKSLELLEQKDREDFETHFTYDGYADCVIVEAVDIHRQPIGRSEVIHTIPPIEEAPEMNETALAKYVSEDWGRWMISVLINPIATFVAGSVASVVIWAVCRTVRKPKARPWWRPKSMKYSAVETGKQNGLLGKEVGADSDADTDDDEDAMELGDSIRKGEVGND